MVGKSGMHNFNNPSQHEGLSNEFANPQASMVDYPGTQATLVEESTANTGEQLLHHVVSNHRYLFSIRLTESINFRWQ